MKKAIELNVNGEAVTAQVEPRLQLADFLREHLALTGTHLGCEHGVCGACTIELDGAPARSCIAYAVACDGAQVRTIEGFDQDDVMKALRAAFSAEHALQCGYCTPGMLVTARDIVLRLPDANEARIRKELAGNLCRCTGYVGIVRAIQRVLGERKRTAQTDGEFEISIQPVRVPGPDVSVAGAPRSSRVSPHAENATLPPYEGIEGEGKAVDRKPGTRGAGLAQPRSEEGDARASRGARNTLHQSFVVDHPREAVWALFGRVGEVATCLPGTSLLGEPTDDHVELRMRVKVGPIVAEFQGAADVVRDAPNYSGVIQGSARDTRSSSTTRGEIRYALLKAQAGAATRVDMEIGYTLTGALAQFSRSGIVQDIAKRMTAAFAENLQAHLNARESGVKAGSGRPRVAELDAGSLFLSVLWNRIKRFFRSVVGR